MSRPSTEIEKESLKELVPIEAVAGPSQDKGKSKEEAEMEGTLLRGPGQLV
jgi:hypothetical protein